MEINYRYKKSYLKYWGKIFIFFYIALYTFKKRGKFLRSKFFGKVYRVFENLPRYFLAFLHLSYF